MYHITYNQYTKNIKEQKLKVYQYWEARGDGIPKGMWPESNLTKCEREGKNNQNPTAEQKTITPSQKNTGAKKRERGGGISTSTPPS